jgi:hypothetical protein
MTNHKLSRTETNLIAAAGGRPITRVTVDDRRRGLALFNLYRRAMGARADVSSAHLFGTAGKANAKMSKDGKVYIAGVTHAPATMVARFWRDAPDELRASIADAAGMTVPELSTLLARATLCARATAGCRAACLVVSSGHMGMERAATANAGRPWYTGNIVRAQLARTLTLLVDPVGAAAIMVACVEKAAKIAAADGIEARWRLAIADDIRWEAVAPVVLTACRRNRVKMYGYTKWSPADRPAPHGARLVRSASERTTIADIAATIAAGHSVAMVFDTPRGQDLPRTWQGMRVVDGDKSDDRTADPRAVIVGLRAKGDAIGSGSRFIFPADDAAATARAANERRRVTGPLSTELPADLPAPVAVTIGGAR